MDQGHGAVQCLVKARWQENGACGSWSTDCVVRAGRNACLFSLSGDSEDCCITVD